MTPVPTPVDGYPHQTGQVQLGDALYTVGWKWNARDRAWYFTLSDVDSVPIISGVRVVLNINLLNGASDVRRPKGAIVVVDPSNKLGEPGLFDLGTRAKVVYIPPEEFAR